MKSHQLTLKQLYGYAIMTWEHYLTKFYDTDDERTCSFCVDSECCCSNCKINKSLCSESQIDTTYKYYADTFNNYRNSIQAIINALYAEYNKIGEK